MIERPSLFPPEAPFLSIGRFLKETFGCKVIKLSLDAAFTCPNRDGSKGTGGCLFCSADGSGDMASDIPGQISLLSRKWPEGKYIAYFQSHTNTYADAAHLRQLYESALNYENADLVGLAIATRPDCLSEEVLDLLAELNQKTFLWVELGLQTIHEDTAAFINRCYPLSVFDEAMEKLSERGIRTVVHLIFGLPKGFATPKKIGLIGERREEMLASLKHVCRTGGNSHLRPFGIKMHLLNVVRGSSLEKIAEGYTPFSSIEEYVDLIVEAISLTPPEITIHRLTADAPRKILISPEWSYQKRTILNNIQRELSLRNIWQGKGLILPQTTRYD